MAGPALFESHAKQTKWEWARSRRQRFSDPVKDIVPPVVVGLVTLGLTVAAGLSVGAATLVSIPCVNVPIG